MFSSSNCESDSCGGWDIALSSDSPVKVASLIRLTLTGNSLERVSVFMGLVNTILAIISFIVGSVRVIAKVVEPWLPAIGNGVGDEEVFTKIRKENILS